MTRILTPAILLITLYCLIVFGVDWVDVLDYGYKNEVKL